MMPNFKKYNHPNLINKKIMSKPKKKKKEWEQKKHLTRLLKPRKANEKKKNKKRERTKIIWLLKLEFKKQKNKKTKKTCTEAQVQHMGIFVLHQSNFPHQVFSPFWEKTFFLGPTIIFPSPSLDQTSSKKFSLFSFSIIFFSLIVSKIHFTKHTLKGKSPLAWSNFFHMFLPTLFPYDYYLCIWGSRDLNHKYLPWKNKMPTG